MPRKLQKIRTVAFVSLGCPKNLVDSERMLGLLAEDGLAVTSNAADADAIVINTCGFLQAAKDESLEAIRQATEHKKSGRCQRIVVAGCLVSRYKTKLLAEVPEVDRLVGVFDREHIVQAVRGNAPASETETHFLGKFHALKAGEKKALQQDTGRLRLTPRHYAYLRISEGCNQGCAFCTIPSIRGGMRSKPVQTIIAEAEELSADGAVELLLIGQDTTSYGTDIGYTEGLAGLVRQLDHKLSHIPWLRLMYAYPSCFTDEMIRALAQSPRFLKYIDMPLQHISDPILERMRRRVTRRETEALLDKLRKWIPGITIRTTFIAGSPGETEAQHRELLAFIREQHFDMLGVFPYSAEPGTSMAKLGGQVPDEVKQARVEELMLAQQEIAFARARSMKGKTVEVLVDSAADREGSLWHARSAAQAPEIDSGTLVKAKGLHPGQFVKATITGHDNYDRLASPAKSTRTPLKVLPRD
jgi:ribosomal protein S12 methylthiotransferase